MLGRRGCSGLLVGALVGCHPAQALDIPEHPGALSTLLLAFDPDARDGAPRVLSVAGEGVRAPFSAQDGGELAVIFFEQDLAQLQLPDGLVTLGGPRRLPAPIQVWRALAPESAFSLSDPAQTTRLLDAIRLAAIDRPRCQADDGCPGAIDGADICVIPCDPPEPTPPEVPRFDWPSDWQASARPPVEGMPLFEPVVPARVDCLPDQRQRYGDTGCSPIGTTCSSRFRPDLMARSEPDLLFVDPTATPGGNGTALLPYRTLEDAVVRASAGSTIALSLGSHVGATVDRDLTIIGACSAGTTVTSTRGRSLAVASGRVSARDLSLESALSRGELVLDRVIASGRLDATAGLLLLRDSSLSVADDVALGASHARLQLEDVSLQGGTRQSILAVSSQVEVRRSWIRGGAGVVGLEGSALSLRQVLLDGAVPQGESSASAVVLSSMAVPLDTPIDQQLIMCRNNPYSSTATLSEVVILGVENDKTDGIDVYCRGHVAVERSMIRHVRGAALRISLLSQVALVDSVLIDDQPTGNELYSPIQVNLEGQLSFLRSYIAVDSNWGLRVDGDGTRLQLEDVVLDTARQSVTDTPIEVKAGSADFVRVWLRGGRRSRISTAENVDLMDVTLLEAEQGLSIKFEGTQNKHGRVLGLSVSASELALELEGCDTGQAFNRACNPLQVSGLILKHSQIGLRAGGGSQHAEGAFVEDFSFEGHHTAAVHLINPQRLIFRRGVIKESAVGFLLDGEGHDQSLIDEVRVYEGSGVATGP